MPLRDHFHPPLDKRTKWESLYGGWPMVIVQHLIPRLLAQYLSEPHVHSTAQVESDVPTFVPADPGFPAPADSSGANWQSPPPSFAVETDLLDADEYGVRVYDTDRNQRLVAAIEIVSPANKDRPEHRQAFVLKCLALLRQGVSVAIVDLVTPRHVNLYVDLLDLLGHHDPTLGSAPPATYAAACRWIERGRKHILETWSHTLALGQPLPTLPLWLAENFSVPLELEASYEETCRVLRME